MAQIEGSNNAMRVILGKNYSRCGETIAGLKRVKKLIKENQMPREDLAKIRAEAQEILYQIGRQVMSADGN